MKAWIRDNYVDADNELPSSDFVYALNDYCQDYYKHYEGYPVEFEYEGKVYPFEYFIDYVSKPSEVK